MTPARRTRRPVLPPVGAAYAVPLANGLWGGCRVVRVGHPAVGHHRPDPWQLLVGVLACVGPTPATGTEPDVGALMQVESHHPPPKTRPALYWVNAKPVAVPADYIRIADLPPAAEELTNDHRRYTTWPQIATHILGEWRLVHDRPALEREEKAERAAEARAARAAAAERLRELNATTLTGLRAERPFRYWRATLPPKVIAASHRAFTP